MKKIGGFTLIELMVVMALVALIVSIAMPRYFEGHLRAQEVALKEDLSVMRKAINDYHIDKGRYPSELESLVAERYIKFIPEDPMTESVETWQVERSQEALGQIYDVRSGSSEIARDGTAYNTW